MTLQLALNNALSGLRVNQRALAVVSNNIANTNTVGYSRQVIDQSQLVLDGIGSGVRIDDISRRVDKYLQRTIQVQLSDVSRADVMNEYMSRIQILLGEPGQNNSLDEYIDSYFGAMQNLTQNPESPSFRNQAVEAGAILAREIATLAEGLHDLRFQADRDIDDAVDIVNRELRQLDTLNVAINQAAALNTSTAGLLDQRDLALERIAEYMDIQTYFRTNGEVQISLDDGTALLDSDLYQLDYSPAPSVNTLIDGGVLRALTVQRVNEDGVFEGPINEIISDGPSSSTLGTVLDSGKIRAYKDIRDITIPQMISSLDMLASRMRDTVNAVHNDGSGFPGASELTGTRSVTSNDYSDWSGKVRISVLDANGQPIRSPYADEAYTGLRPLDLDLTKLDGGLGAGRPTIQSIIQEINNHFHRPPPVKAKLGNLNNIQLVTNNDQLPNGAPPSFNFDFDLENISGQDSRFFLTDVQVFDDSAIPVNITSIASDGRPQFTADPAATYFFTAGSRDIGIQTTAPHGLSNGDFVFMTDPGGLPAVINGIPSAQLVGYFQVENVTATGFTFKATSTATAGGFFNTAGTEVLPKYDTIAAGEKTRLTDRGTMTVSLAGNPAALFYTMQMTVGVIDEDNNISTSVISYRVNNNELNTRNQRYDNTAMTGGTREFPSATSGVMEAMLVDADGNELPFVNNRYSPDIPGFLKLRTEGGDYTISIDELDSKQLGKTTLLNPPETGTNRAFSHYFELNNFFKSNTPTITGDTVAGSALRMAIEDRIQSNPNLITMGDLVRTLQPSDPDATPLYTYERHPGDNSVISRLSDIALQTISFDAAGKIPANTQTFDRYIGDVIGLLASDASSAEDTFRDTNILLEGFTERQNSIKGVNLDEELANTIIYQNAYTASARVITTTNELFEELLNSVG